MPLPKNLWHIEEMVWFWAKVLKWEHIHLMIIICFILLSHLVACSSVVKSLPGFPGSLPFNLETGYIAVGEKEDVEYFYYFVESQGNPRDDPLLLWFTGGPGCSALCGLAFEIGPIRFHMVEYNGSLPTLVLNANSWSKAASIVFVDAPVHTGFSYSRSLEGSQTSDFLFANQSFDFLRKWLIGHPKFISNRLYLGGDSFSGMIIPIIAEEIAKSIEAGHIPKLNFEGYVLGNPQTDIKIDENSKVPFAHRLGLISDELYGSVKKTCKGEYQGRHKNNTPCSKDLEAISLCTKNINRPHILEPKCKTEFNADFKMEQNWKSLLEKPSKANWNRPSISFGNQPPEFPKFGCRAYENLLIYIWANDKAVQNALHIRKGTMKTWIRCNRKLPYTRQVDSVVSYHRCLNSQGYRALIYSGDHDMVIPYIGTQAWIKSLNIPVVDRWRPWLVDDQVAGYVTEHSKGLTFATVKGGGHTAPEFQPKECFAMFKRWISQEPL